MYINRQEIKFKSKMTIRDSNPKIIYVGLVFVLVLTLIGVLSNNLSISYDDQQRALNYIAMGNTTAAMRVYETAMPSFGESLIIFALEIVGDIFSLGFIIFLLNSIRRAAPVWGNLLDGFGMVWRFIALSILEWIFVFLWSLLLVVPGIIASYRYRMAVYLLIDHPEMSPMDCIRESKRMMTGHKGELFVLDLSFIGWNLLCNIPFVGYAAMIWVVPYTETVYAMYYDTLHGLTADGTRPGDFNSQADYVDYGNDRNDYQG